MELKFFNRWGVEGVKVEDAGLVDYVSLEPKVVPKTDARYAQQKFHKSRVSIVERLINKLMVSGHQGKKHKRTSYRNTGKAQTAYAIVMAAFEAIEQRTKKNPVAVFVKALENAAPREEIVSIEYGGARYPKAVECTPQRRIDVALRHMTQGSYAKSFNSRKPMSQCLADEIMNAYGLNSASAAVAKKLELERQADASR